MSIKRLAQEAASNLMAEFEKDMSQAELTKHIENLLLEIVTITKTEYVEVPRTYGQADEDIAHKLAHDVRHKEDVVMANLMGLR